MQQHRRRWAPTVLLRSGSKHSVSMNKTIIGTGCSTNAQRCVLGPKKPKDAAAQPQEHGEPLHKQLRQQAWRLAKL
jgi:hypothetical protein